MAMIKRHWKLTLLNILLLMGGAGLLVWRLGAHPAKGVVNAADSPAADATAADSTKPPATDLLTWSRMEGVRQRLALTSLDLAAMGCGKDQSTQVLSGLLTWYRQNLAGFEQVEQSEVDAKRALNDAVRQVNIGPRDDTVMGSLPGLKTNLNNVASSRRQLDESAASTVAVLLQPQQSQVWSVARANVAVSLDLRFVPNLSQQQIRDVELAASQGNAAQVQALIIQGAKASVDAARESINANLDAVGLAQDAVLPLPEELRPLPMPEGGVPGPTPAATNEP